jgi:hypothetical protein
MKLFALMAVMLAFLTGQGNAEYLGISGVGPLEMFNF